MKRENKSKKVDAGKLSASTEKTSLANSFSLSSKDMGKGELTGMAEKFLALLKKGNRAENILAKELDIDTHSLFDLADGLSKKGYDVRVLDEGDEKIFTLLRGEDENAEAIPIAALNRKFKIGFISEIRMGAKQSQISLLHWIYKEIFEKEDVDFVVVVGGLVIGRPTPTLLPDALKTDPDKLVNYVVKHFPKTKKFKTYIVSGRAELSWKDKDGFDIVSAICNKRDDLLKAGDLEKTFIVKGLRVKTMSPFDDNCPKSVSYGPQGIADKLKDDPLPNIFIIGGTHRRSKLDAYNGMYIATTPSLHMQMRRQARKKVAPYVGCLMMELNFNQDWSINLGGKNEKGEGGLRQHFFRLEDYVNPNDCYGVDFGPASKLEEKARMVLGWFAKEHILAQGDLSRRLKQSKDSVEKIVAELKKCGYAINFRKDSKRYEMEVKEKEVSAPTLLKKEDVFVWATREAGISDTHLGHNKDNPVILRKAYEDAAQAGCRRAYNAGDLSEGAAAAGYKGHVFDLRPGCVSLDDLEDYVVSKWPKDVKVKVDPKHPLLVTKRIDWPDGKIGYEETFQKDGETILQTEAIEGNHDGWAQKGVGRKMVRGLAIRMSQCLRYLGYLVGSVVVDGIYHKLVHPEGGSGACFSTIVEKLLKKVRESNESGDLPAIVYIGHYHSAYLLFDTRLGLRMPCIKDEDVFHETHGLLPFIGMFITDVYLDKSGKNFTRIISEYRDYYPMVKKAVVKETHL